MSHSQHNRQATSPSDKHRGLILVVDDDSEQSFAVSSYLEIKGYSCVVANSAATAMSQVAECGQIDVALLDVNMPGESGFELAAKLRAFPKTASTPVIFLTAQEYAEVAPHIKDGVVDYLRKPIDKDDLLARIEVVLRVAAMSKALENERAENRALKRLQHDRSSYSNIVGNSAAIQAVLDLLVRLEDSEVPVLVTGESGTGKELIAQAVHFNSPRKDKPLLVQNCAALNENLLESELFGHVKGAFTGALRDKPGVFEVANNGTLFLDEVGEMTQPLQAKLLRVLQDGTYSAVGSAVVKKCDVRIIAATNRNLEQMIKSGDFREDLFYRLNVFNIELPPLRARAGDIPLIASHLLEQILKRNNQRGKGVEPVGFAPEALALFERYGWPGNIRELQNEIERAVIMSAGNELIQVPSLSDKIRSSLRSSSGNQDLEISGAQQAGIALSSMREILAACERDTLQAALRATKGNKSEVARLLQMSRTSVVNKIAQYKLDNYEC